MAKKAALLVLEDGTTFHGISFGSDGESFGEAVFNTSMAGYQEILTDPSYLRQIVTMTYPMIGNYGYHPDDSESSTIQAAGFVVREYCKSYSSQTPGVIALHEALIEKGIVAIEGIDTRKLTRHLRERGAMRAGLSTIDLDPKSLLQKVLASPDMNGLDLTSEGSCKTPYTWGNKEKASFHVAALDCGIKQNILRILERLGCHISVWPSNTTPETILAAKPDGFFVSNGPGDPAAAVDVIKTIQAIAGKVPTFGICLGHQMLCHALGAKTFKLKFGHRGGNHPVQNIATGKVEISAQNHGFCVSEEGFPDNLIITHINLNDRTVEGFKHKSLPIIAVQYHPENAPGPRDSEYIFDIFIDMMKNKAS
jgi:carbamoyl-phosphate synthase small subunit